MQVNHDDLTSLGVKYATDPSALGGASENFAVALSKMTSNITGGSSFKIDNTLDIYTLVDFLIKETNGRIINQPTIWTKDNQESELFKGRTIGFTTLSSQTTEGGINNSIDYEDVGLTLRVRPNITPTNAVDMEIFLKISQVEPATVGGNIATSAFQTTTHMIIDDAQTIMLSGYLFQNESEIETKVPILGDIPVLNLLFKHTSTTLTNTELLAFITPYVVSDEDVGDTTELELQKVRKKMDDITDVLNETFYQLDENQEDEEK